MGESGLYLKCEDTRRSIHTMTLDSCRSEAHILRSSDFRGDGNSLFLGIICLYSSAVQLVRLGRQGSQETPAQGGALTAQELEIAPLLKDLGSRWKIGGLISMSTTLLIFSTDLCLQTYCTSCWSPRRFSRSYFDGCKEEDFMYTIE